MKNVRILDIYINRLNKRYLKMNLKNSKILLILLKITKLIHSPSLKNLKPRKTKIFHLLIEEIEIKEKKSSLNFQKQQKN